MKKIVLCAVCVTLTGCQSFYEGVFWKVEPRIEHVQQPKDLFEDKQLRKVTIRSIGDILIHDVVYEAAYTGESYDFDWMFDSVKPYIENADITTANLEVIAAGDELSLSTYPNFNAPSQIIDTLNTIGVDIVNNATNHTLDRGVEGALASIRALQSRDMAYVGSYADQSDYTKPRIIEVNNVKVGFLSYAYGANGHIVPDEYPYILSLIDEEVMIKEIKQIKEQVDLVVVMVHLGEEYEDYPNQIQQSLYATLHDAGANYVLGGHPHVLQPFDLYSSSQVTLYSHANFLSGQIELATKIGGISEVTFEEVTPGEFLVSSIRFMPTYNLGGVDGYTYSVIPLVEAEEYGMSFQSSYFDYLTELMTSYTSEVEVVEYLTTELD